MTFIHKNKISQNTIHNKKTSIFTFNVGKIRIRTVFVLRKTSYKSKVPLIFSGETWTDKSFALGINKLTTILVSLLFKIIENGSKIFRAL